MSNIKIKNARVNNLKNLSVEIPREKLVVITGLSGSGKSSLAFDTLFAEGQRRFAESLSSYARQFLGRMSKPDVDGIEGIPPAIAIEQKVNIRNPRSTVGTTTEIYDYIRLLFARIGHTFSPISGREVKANSAADVLESLLQYPADATLFILADLNWQGRDDKVELMLSLKEQGYTRLWCDGKPMRIEDVLQLGDALPANAALLVDRVRIPAAVEDAFRVRVLASCDAAFREGKGRLVLTDGSHYHEFINRMELDGITFVQPEEYLFSFNSPLGACPVCGGLGKIIGVSEDLVVPDKTLSLYDGAIACWRGEKMSWFRDHLVEVAPRYGINVFEPYCRLSDREKQLVWDSESVEGDEQSLVGINEFFRWVEKERYKIQYRYMLNRFSGKTTCHDCHGSRLKKEALYVKVGGKNIHEVLSMNVTGCLEYFRTLELSETEKTIAEATIKEITSRLECLEDVGLSYLTLERTCNTLSGGESQRINLVTALGSSLVGSMYILDEPSIGLHPRDTDKLIQVLKRLRDIGNTVVVVEHDEEIIKAADVLIDMGPRAGVNGGEIIYQGVASQAGPEDVSRSLTLQYLTGERKRIDRKKRSWSSSIVIEGAMEHNLKGGDFEFPLGALTVVTGVSGSGKSSLVSDILYPALNRKLNDSGDLPGTFKGLGGSINKITRVEFVDQNPIGKSTRSNAATYLKVYDDIRKLLSLQQFAKVNGFGANFFSFNTDGGRCPECQGEGVVKIGMQFMADVTMVCDECGGKRFKPAVLDVRFRDKNVDDILGMSIDEAIKFFSEGFKSDPDQDKLCQSIALKLQPLADVGLGYIKLGQSSSTLSGGESQRIKLAYFLSLSQATMSRQKIMFIFDEPTTGLHFYDVEKLLKAFEVLLSKGHSLVVVEHNLDVIRAADWVIDLGPDAGDQGGELVFAGTPEDLIKSGKGYTARYLASV